MYKQFLATTAARFFYRKLNRNFRLYMCVRIGIFTDRTLSRAGHSAEFQCFQGDGEVEESIRLPASPSGLGKMECTCPSPRQPFT